MRQHTVTKGVADMPLGAYLRRAFPMVPAYVFREALKKRDVRVNGTRSDAQATVRGGDRLHLYIDERFFAGDLRVLFRDAGLLVLEKPQGLPVDDDGNGVGADTLLVRARGVAPSARLAHRLDAGTGGVILLSLNEETHESLLAAFREETIAKRYALAVAGAMCPTEGTLRSYIRKDADISHVCVFDVPVPGALTAITEYRTLGVVEEAGVEIAYVEADIHTGRTHQIRAQFAHAGCPVVGDDKYGDRSANAALHVRMPSLWCRSMTLHGDMLPERYRGLTFISEPGFPLWRLFAPTCASHMP